MDQILFLCGSDDARAHNDNHRRLPAAFRRAGWTVATAAPESLRLARGELLCDAGPLSDFDRIWVLGFGERSSFLDRMQLLADLPQDRLVTRIDALLKLHGKAHWHRYLPPTFASCDADYLLAQTGQGHDWIVKPTAGAFGRDLHALPEQMPTEQKTKLLKQLTADGRYWLLQRHLPQAQDGEKRVLYGGGLLLGSYLRRPAESGAKPDAPATANLATGAAAERCTLAPAERKLAGQIADELIALGVGFAAIDLVHPYLMEVNIANPGGLGTLQALYGEDPTPALVAALVDFWS